MPGQNSLSEKSHLDYLREHISGAKGENAILKRPKAGPAIKPGDIESLLRGIQELAEKEEEEFNKLSRGGNDPSGEETVRDLMVRLGRG